MSGIPVALLILLAGCSGGGGGGGGTTAGQAQLISVVNAGNDTFVIDYEVNNSSEPVSLEVEYSEDLGNSYQPVSSVSGENLVLRNSVVNSFTWHAFNDLGETPQGDVVLRVTPYGQTTGIAGTADVSSPFSYRGNSAPGIILCQAAATPAGSPTAISVTAADAESDTVAITAAITMDGGASFTPVIVTSPSPARTTLSAGGAAFTVQLDSTAALGEGLFTNVQARITLQESSESDTALTSAFTLNTHRPLVSTMTIESIPEDMNGSATFTNLSGNEESYRLLVPGHGFCCQIGLDQDGAGQSPDPGTLQLWADKPIGPDQDIAAGTNLAPLVTWAGDTATLSVDSQLQLPPGSITLSATVSDLLGNTATTTQHAFNVESPNQAAYPFVSADQWGLTFDRDGWTMSSTCTNDDVSIAMEFVANGREDFLEDLALIGLYHFDYPELGALSAAYVKERILAQLRTFYQIEEDGTHTDDSPGITFTLDTAAADSLIALGGADPGGGYTLGRAYFDRCNNNRESNVASDLGVFSTNLIRFYINISYSFKELLNAFIPGRGDPLGTLPEDAVILAGDFVYGAPENTSAEDERYEAYQDAADGFARALAAILAHEIGHSIGLVANGPPPEGLFGGEENADFTGYWTSPYHIDTTGNNIMESSMSFSSTQYTGTYALRFNELNMAYLLERILLER